LTYDTNSIINVTMGIKIETGETNSPTLSKSDEGI
jgi:hypothetical protein